MTSSADFGMRWQRAVLASDMSYRAKLVGCALAVRADWTTGEIDPRFSPSLEKLAANCSVSSDTVSAGVDELELGKFLQRVSGGGRHVRNQYTLLLHTAGDSGSKEVLADDGGKKLPIAAARYYRQQRHSSSSLSTVLSEESVEEEGVLVDGHVLTADVAFFVRKGRSERTS